MHAISAVMNAWAKEAFYSNEALPKPKLVREVQESIVVLNLRSHSGVVRYLGPEEHVGT